MEEGEVHCIINLDKYAYHIRKSAAVSFAKGEKLDEREDLETFVTVIQVSQMVAENAMGQDEEGHYLITDEGYKNLTNEQIYFLSEVNRSSIKKVLMLENPIVQENNHAPE